MTKEYSSPSTSPLSTPRSRAVVALLDKTRSKLGRHRNGQRKISEIVQENNALISGILGLNSEESERGGAGELSVSRSASAPVDGEVVEKLQAELQGKIQELEQSLQEQTAENLGLEKKVSRITGEAHFFEKQYDKLLSYLSEDELRVIQKGTFEVEIDRLGSEIANLNAKNMSLSERLEDFERNIQFSIEPRGSKHSRESWIANIMKASELDYIRTLSEPSASTSGPRPSAAFGKKSVNGCNFLLDPDQAGAELQRLKDALAEMGKKVLIVEKARDSAYQEIDYVDVKTKKIYSQVSLAKEKLENIKTFQKKLQELSKENHQENILTRKRVSYSEFYKDKAKYYVPQFDSNIENVVKATTTFSALPDEALGKERDEPFEEAVAQESVEEPAMMEEELSDKVSTGDNAGVNQPEMKREEEEEEEEGGEGGEDVSSKSEDRSGPPPEVGEQSPSPPPIQELSQENVEEKSSPSSNPREMQTQTPSAQEREWKDNLVSPSASDSLAVSSSTQNTEGGIQTPNSVSPSTFPVKDTPVDQEAEEDSTLDFPSPTVADPLTNQVDKINQRLFEIKKRKALAYRDLSTATLRILAEESLEEKDLHKKLKKLQKKRGRRYIYPLY